MQRYRQRNRSGIDWTFVLVAGGTAIVGGLLGTLLSWVGILIGLVVLIAAQFLNDIGDTGYYGLMFLAAGMLAAGIGSLIWGSAQSLTAEQIQDTESLSGNLAGFSQKINEVLFDAVGATDEGEAPQALPSSVTGASTSSSSTTSSSSWDLL